MKFVHWLFGIMLCVSFLFSQNVTVTATVDSQSVGIGDWIHLSLDVQHPSSMHAVLPALKDTLGVFDIVRQDSLQKSEKDNVVHLTKNFVLSKYTGGSFYIPPIAVQFTDSTGKIQTAQSNPIPIDVRSIEVDTSKAIKDVKPQLSIPMSAAEIAMYVGIVLALGGIGYGIYYYWKKRKQNVTVVEDEEPAIPPHILALQKLDELEAAHLWQSGEVKQFYSTATEIVRDYFERRYGIMALEMTTGEVMEQLVKFKLDKPVHANIEGFLSDADLVKFAKHNPIPAENEHVIPQAKMIVERTKPVEQSVESKEDVPANA
ncbi:MAG: hypothetical protein PHP42_03255 [Bacteroidota bacterium]|nr:hypothetical protein [Bacteroidota bacterium]